MTLSRCSSASDYADLACPEHGVVTEGVEFARPGSMFTRDVEDLAAWLTIRADKTCVSSFLRVAWRSVGTICERVCDEQLDDSRFEGLVKIGVDEISWPKHHNYVTLVTNSDTGKVVYGTEGKNAATLDLFFEALGTERTAKIKTVSMDMGLAFQKAVRARAPLAVICFDPFHVVQLATKALDQVRRRIWREQAALPGAAFTKLVKGCRWALLKNPENLTTEQAARLAGMKESDTTLRKVYTLKEALRYLFTSGLDLTDITRMIGLWCDRAIESGEAAFMKAGETVRKYAAGIEAALKLGVSNGQQEGLNNKVRTISRRAYGFHSANAMIALVMLACGPVAVNLPYPKLARCARD